MATPAEPVAPVWAIFSISGPDLIPEGITLELGLQPDRILPPVPLEDLDGFWQLHSTLPATAPLGQHLSSLLERLAPVRAILSSIRERPGIRLEFYASIQKGEAEHVETEIEPRILLLVGHLGAYLAVDLE